MKIESITKSGSKVIVEGTPSSEVSVSTTHGVFTGYWGTTNGIEGIVCKGKINGKEMLICVQIPKKDWETFQSGIKSELIKNVPGLDELISVRNAESQYIDDFNAMMDDEFNDGVSPPVKPVIQSKDVAERYPIAAAYLKAEVWENSSHFAKSAAGRKAKVAISEGYDYVKAIASMETEWTDYCNNVVD